MILRSRQLDAGELARATGWTLTPDGFCKGETCIAYRVPAGGRIDARDVASRLAMPLVEDAGAGLWALGPPSGGRALASSEAPDLELPDLDGQLFRLSSLRGWKVLLLAWAPW